MLMTRKSLLLLCCAGGAAAFSPASLPLAGIRPASSPGLCQLRATTAPGVDAAAPAQGWLANVQRPVTTAEVRAVQRQAKGLTGADLERWLEGRGYAGELLQEVAKQASLPAKASGTEWEKKLEEAAALEAKMEGGARKRAALEAQAAGLAAEASGALTEAIAAAKQALDDATADAQQWGWVPVAGPAKTQAKDDAHKAYGAAMAAKETAEQEAAECLAGAQVLGASLEAEEAQVAALKAEAAKTRMRHEAEEAALRLRDAAKVIEAAEGALVSGGAGAALAALADGKPKLQALGLKPNRRIGAGSLPGRLAALLDAAHHHTRPSSSSSSAFSSAAAGMDSEEMSRGAFIGGALALAAAGAGAFLYKPPPAGAPAAKKE